MLTTIVSIMLIFISNQIGVPKPMVTTPKCENPPHPNPSLKTVTLHCAYTIDNRFIPPASDYSAFEQQVYPLRPQAETACRHLSKNPEVRGHNCEV
ncbi:MAG: hypothetical protein AAGU11_06990 [Syntrophobacteraceae bacterium]